jgi:hypothetical protein
LFNIKKKVKNKTNIEASIYEAYIVEKISIFILYCFKPHLRIRINCVPRHDDSDKMPSNGNLPISSHLRWPLSKNIVRGRYLIEIEFRYAHNYVLFNFNELRSFI